jgi:ubiquinone/menaquinone biosynthesis C-methylase UbiE
MTRQLQRDPGAIRLPLNGLLPTFAVGCMDMDADLPSAPPEKTALTAKIHWEAIHQAKAAPQLSWFQRHAGMSMDFIRRTGVDRSSAIIDIGGGISSLVDDLLAEGFTCLTVLDVSRSALQQTRQRLGESASGVTWIEADITHVSLPENAYSVWHDRAVFHFLTRAEDRQRYLHALCRSLKPGGHAIVATFAPDGPSKCSGLEVVRYSAESLAGGIGDGFALLESARERHITPSGAEQRFVYCHFRKR